MTDVKRGALDSGGSQANQRGRVNKSPDNLNDGPDGGDHDLNASAGARTGSNFLGLGGKRGLSKSNKQAKSNDCIGVPPGMTESSPRRQDPADFEDEEEEDDAHNNFLTQSELFKSYAE